MERTHIQWPKRRNWHHPTVVAVVHINAIEEWLGSWCHCFHRHHVCHRSLLYHYYVSCSRYLFVIDSLIVFFSSLFATWFVAVAVNVSIFGHKRSHLSMEALDAILSIIKIVHWTLSQFNQLNNCHETSLAFSDFWDHRTHPLSACFRSFKSKYRIKNACETDSVRLFDQVAFSLLRIEPFVDYTKCMKMAEMRKSHFEFLQATFQLDATSFTNFASILNNWNEFRGVVCLVKRHSIEECTLGAWYLLIFKKPEFPKAWKCGRMASVATRTISNDITILSVIQLYCIVNERATIQGKDYLHNSTYAVCVYVFSFLFEFSIFISIYACMYYIIFDSDKPRLYAQGTLRLVRTRSAWCAAERNVECRLYWSISKNILFDIAWVTFI